MTFVGKILVVVIMAMSLIFLGISVVVFTTEKNWRDDTKQAKAAYDELKRKNDAIVVESTVAKKDLDGAKTLHDAAKKTLDDRINVLNADIAKAQEENTQSKAALTTAQQNAQTALDEAKAMKKDTDLLHVQRSAVEQQANVYKLRQTELNDQIRQLNRMLETATKNGNDLRERAGRPTL